MSFKFGTTSQKNLEGVYPALVRVAKRALEISTVDGTVIGGGGLRTLAQAQENVKNKTGILNSLHRKQPDEYGHAIDLIPYPIKWKNNMPAFKEMARAVKQAAAELKVPIRQGCDWNMNGVWGESREWDWPHFEYPEARHMDKATKLMNEHRVALDLDLDDEEEAPDTGRGADAEREQEQAKAKKFDAIKDIVTG